VKNKNSTREYEGTFQGTQPSVPGFMGPWTMKIQLDNGEEKEILVTWGDALAHIKKLDLKKGDRIKVRLGTRHDNDWKVKKLN